MRAGGVQERDGDERCEGTVRRGGGSTGRERGSGEGRHRDRGRGSHFQGKMRQGREEGSKGKSEEGWRRRGKDQGKIKPPQ